MNSSNGKVTEGQEELQRAYVLVYRSHNIIPVVPREGLRGAG